MNFKTFCIPVQMICYLFLSPELICAQVESKSDSAESIIRVMKSQDFQITGDGSADSWKAVDWLTLSKRDNKGAGYQTRLKLLYSDSGIYCLFNCADNKITATKKADFLDLYLEDVVEVFFWPDETLPLYFEYELSPLNFELPILVPNIKGNFFGWTPWHYEGRRKTSHATHINYKNEKTLSVNSWTAEFFIPYQLLKPIVQLSPIRGTRWRANFYRIDYDENVSHWSWQLTRTNFHDFERFGTLLFD